MTERELERRAKHKLAVLRHVEEVSGRVSAASRAVFARLAVPTTLWVILPALLDLRLAMRSE